MDYWPLRRWRPADPPLNAGRPALRIRARGPASPASRAGIAARYPRVGLDLLCVEKIPMLAIVLWVAQRAMQSQAAAGAINPLDGLPLDGRLANALVSYVAYLGKDLLADAPGHLLSARRHDPPGAALLHPRLATV